MACSRDISLAGRKSGSNATLAVTRRVSAGRRKPYLLWYFPYLLLSLSFKYDLKTWTISRFHEQEKEKSGISRCFPLEMPLETCLSAACVAVQSPSRTNFFSRLPLEKKGSLVKTSFITQWWFLTQSYCCGSVQSPAITPRLTQPNLRNNVHWGLINDLFVAEVQEKGLRLTFRVKKRQTVWPDDWSDPAVFVPSSVRVRHLTARKIRHALPTSVTPLLRLQVFSQRSSARWWCTDRSHGFTALFCSMMTKRSVFCCEV